MKEDKSIDKLIRDSLRVEKSSEGLTDSIMAKIEAAEQVEERALKSLMGRHVLESPSPNFVSRVMEQIESVTESESAIVTNPVIIGKKAWVVIISTLVVFVLYVLQSGTASEASPKIYEDLMGKTGDFFNQLGGQASFQLPELVSNPLFAISLFALSLLLLVEHILRYNRISAVHHG